MDKINAAIIGLGRIASLLEEDSLREKPCTHAGAIAANPDCYLAAGCDIDKKRRLLFAEKWQNKLCRQVPVYNDAAEMLRVHKPQILAIATPPDSHYHYCRLAAKEGVPVIICEKPLADTLSDARKIARLAKYGSKVEAAAAKSRPVIITNHERRYSLDYIRAKKILDDEKLGSMLSVHACLYMGKKRRLIEQLWHDGTHLADAIMFLTGAELKHRQCRGTDLTSRTGTAWLEGELIYKTNKKLLPVIIEVGAGRDHLVFEIEFSCEQGRLRIGNGIFEVWESAPSPYAEYFRSLKNTGEVFTGPTGYFANMIKDAVSCVREGGRPRVRLPFSSAADGLKVIEYLSSVGAWRGA